MPKHWRTAGLDQLGPVHYHYTDPLQERGNTAPRGLTARAKQSTTRRKVKVTLPVITFGEPKCRPVEAPSGETYVPLSTDPK